MGQSNDAAIARAFFIGTMIGVVLGGIAGWFYYDVSGALVGSLGGAFVGLIGALVTQVVRIRSRSE